MARHRIRVIHNISSWLDYTPIIILRVKDWCISYKVCIFGNAKIETFILTSERGIFQEVTNTDQPHSSPDILIKVSQFSMFSNDSIYMCNRFAILVLYTSVCSYFYLFQGCSSSRFKFCSYLKLIGGCSP